MIANDMNRERGAIYRYFIRDFNSNTLKPNEVPCLIVGETDRSYRIKLTRPINRRAANESFWVRKKSIIFICQ